MEFIEGKDIRSLANPGVVSRQLLNPEIPGVKGSP